MKRASFVVLCATLACTLACLGTATAQPFPSRPVTLIVPNDPASISYVRDIVARGEAAKADENGKLPPGKTHEIVGEVASGLPILKRIRIY